MTDWKKKIDELRNQQRHDHFEKEDKEKRALQEIADRERQKKIDWLGKKFKCHIAQCGKLPTVPYVEEKETSADWSRIKYVDHWDLPGDLWTCEWCHKWTCKDHVYNGVCMECAEKM